MSGREMGGKMEWELVKQYAIEYCRFLSNERDETWSTNLIRTGLADS